MFCGRAVFCTEGFILRDFSGQAEVEYWHGLDKEVSGQ